MSKSLELTGQSSVPSGLPPREVFNDYRWYTYLPGATREPSWKADPRHHASGPMYADVDRLKSFVEAFATFIESQLGESPIPPVNADR